MIHGIIYKIFNGKDCYYGSTIMTLKDRLKTHISDLRRYLNNPSTRRCCSVEIMKNEYECIILEEGEYEDKKSLRKIENEYIMNNDCVNKMRAYTSNEERKEYAKKFREKEENKEHAKEYQKKYREKNKEKIMTEKRVYYLKKKQLAMNREI
jgi:hypothetical protein